MGEDIFDEILDKMHQFGVDHNGKSPNWLYLNHDHYDRIMASRKFYGCFTFIPCNGRLSKIVGMQFVVKEDIVDVDVQ